MTSISMITSKDCEMCKKMKTRVDALLKNNGVKAKINEYDSDSDEAVSLAMAMGIGNIPAMVVNGVVFETSDFDAKEFIDAAR